MKRKDFLRNAFLTGLGTMLFPAAAKSKDHPAIEDQVGFNHLPNENTATANTVYHAANTRGYANHGWLETYHTFSFANYRNPSRNNFGVLRVLNDDKITGGKGFRTHPHNNMEIITIPLEGGLQHKDSMGNAAVIKHGEVQVMSAGTGVYHSEFNSNQEKDGRFLQIWLYPNKQGVTPRYDQISLKDIEKKNEFYQILSPKKEDKGVWIHQQAWFHLGDFNKKTTKNYSFNKAGNGLYIFVIEGSALVGTQKLNRRDGYGVWNTSKLEIECSKDSRILLMEVPMTL